MKKLFVSAAVVAVSLFGMNTFAQTPQNPSKCNKQETECKATKCDKNCDIQAQLFEGITLTDNQQAQLKALGEKRKEAAKQCKEAKDKQFKQNDSIRMAQKRQNLKEIQSILTPEQYVIYLENIVVSNPNGGKAIMRNGHRGDKGHFDGRHHGDKKDRADRTQRQPRQDKR